MLEKNVGEALVELDKVVAAGKSPLVFASDMVSYFRDLLLVYTLKNDARKIVVVKDDVFEKMKTQATEKTYASILKAIEDLSGVEQELRFSVQPRIVLETAIIKTITESSLLERVEKLEETVKNFPR